MLRDLIKSAGHTDGRPPPLRTLRDFLWKPKSHQHLVHLCPKRKRGGRSLPGLPLPPLCCWRLSTLPPQPAALTQGMRSAMGSLDAPALLLRRNLTLFLLAHDYPP